MGTGGGHYECAAAARWLSATELKIPEEHRAVVHIFAAMAINANHYGATS